MSEISFSVIIPAYNSSEFLTEAIRSVLAQRYACSEIIVVNDGSTDTTLEVASGFGDKVTVVDQVNSGAAASRNNGIKQANGDYLAFLDADDLWLPDKLALQADKIRSGFPMVYTNRYNFGEVGDLPKVQTEIMNLPEGEIWRMLIKGNMVTTSSVVIKKKIFAELGGFNPTLPPCEDWDLWLKCAEQYPIGCCQEPLVKYRLHPGGISRNYAKMHEMRKLVVQRALGSEKGRALPEKEKRQIHAGIWSSSGWEAAVAKDYRYAFSCYSRALSFTKLDWHLWYDIARVMAGRV